MADQMPNRRKEAVNSDGLLKGEREADKRGGGDEASAVQQQRQSITNRQRMQDINQQQHSSNDLHTQMRDRSQTFQRGGGNPSDPSENSESLLKREHQTYEKNRMIRDFEREA